jgi:hypothetical protein
MLLNVTLEVFMPEKMLMLVFWLGTPHFRKTYCLCLQPYKSTCCYNPEMLVNVYFLCLSFREKDPELKDLPG